MTPLFSYNNSLILWLSKISIFFPVFLINTVKLDGSQRLENPQMLGIILTQHWCVSTHPNTAPVIEKVREPWEGNLYIPSFLLIQMRIQRNPLTSRVSFPYSPSKCLSFSWPRFKDNVSKKSSQIQPTQIWFFIIFTPRLFSHTEEVERLLRVPRQQILWSLSQYILNTGVQI